MPSPFPGMDPYLEAPSLWPDVHSALIVAIRDALSPQVAPSYFVRVEQRTYILELDDRRLLGRPDVAVVETKSRLEQVAETALAAGYATASQVVTLPLIEEVHEGYLEIHDTRTHEVITVIEVLSPGNKTGEGRRAYEAKRREVLRTCTSLVEIDLLRAGRPMEMQPVPPGDYRILIHRGWQPGRAQVATFNIRQPIPEAPVPLRQGEPDAILQLERLLGEVYGRARYDLSLDYLQPPEPPLAEADAAWTEGLLNASVSQ